MRRRRPTTEQKIAAATNLSARLVYRIWAAKINELHTANKNATYQFVEPRSTIVSAATCNTRTHTHKHTHIADNIYLFLCQPSLLHVGGPSTICGERIFSPRTRNHTDTHIHTHSHTYYICTNGCTTPSPPSPFWLAQSFRPSSSIWKCANARWLVWHYTCTYKTNTHTQQKTTHVHVKADTIVQKTKESPNECDLFATKWLCLNLNTIKQNAIAVCVP